MRVICFASNFALRKIRFLWSNRFQTLINDRFIRVADTDGLAEINRFSLWCFASMVAMIPLSVLFTILFRDVVQKDIAVSIMYQCTAMWCAPLLQLCAHLHARRDRGYLSFIMFIIICRTAAHLMVRCSGSCTLNTVYAGGLQATALSRRLQLAG